MPLNPVTSLTSSVNTLNLRIQCVTLTNCTISAAGAAVTLSFATVTDSAYVVGKIEGGYDAAPTGGSVKVTDYAGNVYFSQPLTSAGPAPFNLNDLLLPVSTGMKIVLAGGGGAVLGHLNARPHLEK